MSPSPSVAVSRRSVAVLLACMILVACVRVAGAKPDLDAARLKAIVQAEADAAGTNGVMFGIWQDDRPILVTALGRSMTTVPASTDMHWRIGGITETFQATLLHILAERGRIDLDAKISKWMPDLLDADKVTVRMLVQNRAGYVDYVRLPAFGEAIYADVFRTFTPAEMIAWAVKDGRMAYAPGTSQAYSHTEYVILGEVVEKATGQSMKSLYEQYVFGPLGLKDTQFPTTQEIQAPVLHAYLSDRKVFEDSTYWNPSWAGNTGALTSNLHDLGRWGPIFGTGKLLSAASFKEMIAPSSVGLGKNTADLYFAQGFVVNHGWFVQNPNMNGYCGGFAYDPVNRVTIVVAATKNAKPAIDPAAFHILRSVIQYVTPDRPLTFGH